ncbi:MAG: hypothetical protein AVDCRST_MAG08-3501, partial [uncultured Acetobacteraceae bacterium]
GRRRRGRGPVRGGHMGREGRPGPRGPASASRSAGERPAARLPSREAPPPERGHDPAV